MKSIKGTVTLKNTIQVRVSDQDMRKLNDSITGNNTISNMVRQLISDLPTRHREQEFDDTKNTCA